MKSIYSFFALVLCSSLLFSQNLPKGYALGYYFDETEQFIGGYADADYRAVKPFKVSYTEGSDFESGYYFDTQNVKHVGWILNVRGGKKIRFKSSKESEIVTIPVKLCNSYVVGRDSFAVLVNNTNKKGFYEDEETDNEKCFFALVLGQTANNSFYQHEANSNGVIRYSVSTGDKGGYELFPKSADAFNQMAKKYFEGYSILSRKLMLNHYAPDDIPNMVKLANYQECSQNNDKIYFSRAWTEVKDSAQADKYCVVERFTTDTVLVVKHFFMDGTPISKMLVTSIIPYRTVGASEYYFPNGTVRKRKTTKVGETLTTYFYPNGTPLFDIVNKEKSPSSETYKAATGPIFVSPQYKEVRKPQTESELLQAQDDANSISSKNRKYLIDRVFDKGGQNVLDNKGNGSFSFFDDIKNRTIEYEFADFKPKTAYYTDSIGRLVYQKCDRPAKILVDKLPLLRGLPDLLNYQKYNFDPDARGVTLVRFLVEPSGLVSDYEIIKSVGVEYDNQISNFFKYTTMYACYSPAVVGKVKVAQEVVMPFVFEWISYRPTGNYHYNYWMMNNMMHQNNMMMQNAPKNIPMGPRF